MYLTSFYHKWVDVDGCAKYFYRLFLKKKELDPFGGNGLLVFLKISFVII